MAQRRKGYPAMTQAEKQMQEHARTPLGRAAKDYIGELEHQGVEPGAYHGATLEQIASAVADFVVWRALQD